LLTGQQDGAVGSSFEHVQQSANSCYRWFAVYTTPRHEKRVAEHLCLRQIEYFLPLYRALRKWKDGSRVTLELPLFPNYIFVRISRRERIRVLEVPGVLSLAGCGREPTPLPDAEIEGLRRVGMAKIEPHPCLVVGEKVRIKDGVMAGVEGVLVRKNNSFRVILTLRMIMQSFAVEVDAASLEPALSVHDRIANSSVSAA
jgi:transcription antitermination factor NusG